MSIKDYNIATDKLQAFIHWSKMQYDVAYQKETNDFIQLIKEEKKIYESAGHNSPVFIYTSSSNYTKYKLMAAGLDAKIIPMLGLEYKTSNTVRAISVLMKQNRSLFSFLKNNITHG